MPYESTKSPGAHDRSSSSHSYKSPNRRRSSPRSLRAGSQNLPPILDHLSSYPNTPNSDSLLLPALSSLKVISPPNEPTHYPTPTSPSEMDFHRRNPDEPIEEHEWVYIFSEIIRQAKEKGRMASASEILFHAIQDSNYDPTWEDLALPGGRSLRTWQDGYRNFPHVSGFTPSGIAIPPRRMKPELSIPGRRTLAPKPPTLTYPGPSAGLGSPATQSPLVTVPTTEPTQPGRRKRGRPSKKDAAARREQDKFERQTKLEQESQMPMPESSFLFSQGTQGPGPSSRTFGSIPESPSIQRYAQKRSTPRVPSNNGSSGNSGSSGRRKRRQQSKNPMTNEPPPSFALSSIEGRFNQPQSQSQSQQQHSHQRGSSYYGGQQGPLPPPRTSSQYATSSHQYGQRQQSQPAQLGAPQQALPTTQPESRSGQSRSGQSRSEGKSELKNILNEQ